MSEMTLSDFCVSLTALTEVGGRGGGCLGATLFYSQNMWTEEIKAWTWTHRLVFTPVPSAPHPPTPPLPWLSVVRYLGWAGKSGFLLMDCSWSCAGKYSSSYQLHQEGSAAAAAHRSGPVQNLQRVCYRVLQYVIILSHSKYLCCILEYTVAHNVHTVSIHPLYFLSSVYYL